VIEGDTPAAAGLAAALEEVRAAVDANDPQRARELLAAFSAAVVDRSRDDGIAPRDASDLVCGASNLLITLPSAPVPQAEPIAPAPVAAPAPAPAPAPAAPPAPPPRPTPMGVD
jgi:hypothetical protein